MKANNEIDELESIMIYQVVTEFQVISSQIPSINDCPHIFIKLCDGDIIEAQNGERITDISQFIMANKIEEQMEMEIDPSCQLGPTPAIVDQFSPTPTSVYQSSQTPTMIEQQSQPLLTHEEVVSITIESANMKRWKKKR